MDGFRVQQNAFLAGGAREQTALPDALERVQKHISATYPELLTGGTEGTDILRSYITKYLLDERISVEGHTPESLTDTLHNEMTGFSILSAYLDGGRTDIEEIDVNSWDCIIIHYSSGEVRTCEERFFSPQHALDVIKRLLHESGMILDMSKPVVVGHLNNKIRITVMGEGIIDRDKGVAASIRIVNPKKLKRDDLLRYGTATEEMLDFLTYAYQYGLSMCISGATFSGKTTLMSYILSLLPHDRRLVTIEQSCREFDCTVRDEDGRTINDVIHLITRPSEIPEQDIDMVRLLETTLTINPDNVAVAEMKGAESFLAISAANTGHAVITTIHADSCEDTYDRMMTLCKLSQDIGEETIMRLAVKAFPVVAFAKKLEDNSRRIMEITECEGIDPATGLPAMRTLYEYVIDSNAATNDGHTAVLGHYEKKNNPSDRLVGRLRRNGMPTRTLTGLFGDMP